MQLLSILKFWPSLRLFYLHVYICRLIETRGSKKTPILRTSLNARKTCVNERTLNIRYSIHAFTMRLKVCFTHVAHFLCTKRNFNSESSTNGNTKYCANNRRIHTDSNFEPASSLVRYTERANRTHDIHRTVGDLTDMAVLIPIWQTTR